MSEKEQYSAVPVTEMTYLGDTVATKSVDDFLKMSSYSYLILLTSEFILLCAAGNMVYMVFAGSAPRVSCSAPNGTIVDICKSHPNITELTNCELGLEYEFKSVNVEFDYLCSDGRWVKSSISVQMLGVLIGTLVFGTMSDRYGRKSSLVVSFIMTSLLSIASSFSTTLLTFTVIRTVLGFFNGGLLGTYGVYKMEHLYYSTYGVYKMEHIPKMHRFWVATVIAWAPNFILLNGLAYISHDWRTFQRLLVLISSPALIMFFFVCESPRWLIQMGRIEEARRVLQHIQHIDRQKAIKKEEMQEMLDTTYQIMQARNEKVKSYNLRHLFYNKEMSLATAVFCSGVLMTSMINYGLVFNIELLSGSFFINSTIMGIIRWAINIVFGVLDFKSKVVGRKMVHFISQASIAVCLGAIAVIYLIGLDDDFSYIIRISTIFAAATTSQTFITKTISAMEYYPTVVRNSGLALKSTCSRLGTILAPQLFILSTWESFPYLVLTIMAAFDTIAYHMVIPETKGKSLPDDLPKKNRRNPNPLA